MLTEASAACSASEAHNEVSLGCLRFPFMLILSSVNSSYHLVTAPSALPCLHNTFHSCQHSPKQKQEHPCLKPPNAISWLKILTEHFPVTSPAHRGKPASQSWRGEPCVSLKGSNDARKQSERLPTFLLASLPEEPSPLASIFILTNQSQSYSKQGGLINAA